MKNKITDYDGLVFIEGDAEGTFDIQPMNVNIDLGDLTGGNETGDMYHVAFFTATESGDVEITDEFDAIFTEPLTYLQNLIGVITFGVMLKKRQNSIEWFKNYLTSIVKSYKMEYMLSTKDAK